MRAKKTHPTAVPRRPSGQSAGRHGDVNYAEEKIRIILQGRRGEENIAELCRREQINQNL